MTHTRPAAPEVFLNPDALSDYLVEVIGQADPADVGTMFDRSYLLGIVHVTALLSAHYYPDLSDATRTTILDAYSRSVARAIVAAFEQSDLGNAIDPELKRMATPNHGKDITS